MEIQHKGSEKNGKFYLEGEDGILAELIYTSREHNVISLDHTEVDESLKGEGVGSKLVKESVAYARENNLKIDPICPFAEAQFKRNDSYSDVLAS